MKLFWSIFFILLSCNSEKPYQQEQIIKIEPIPELTDLDISPKNRGLFAEHYPASNERRIDLFMPKIQNLGGGYIGVGTDQNFSFIAKAKSECAFLMDFDEEIVKVNQLHMFFWENSRNYSDFKNFWNPKNKKLTEEFIKEIGFSKSKIYLDAYKLGLSSNWVPGRLEELEFMHKKFGLVTFSHSDEEFQYIKQLIEKKRILALVGNLLGDKTMNQISQTAKSLNCPIRILYTSNAEEYFSFPESFRSNIKNLFIDDKSLVLRTITAGTKYGWGYPEGEKFPDNYPFHYNIQKIQNLQAWMSLNRPLKISDIMKGRTSIVKGFSEINKLPNEVGY